MFQVIVLYLHQVLTNPTEENSKSIGKMRRGLVGNRGKFEEGQSGTVEFSVVLILPGTSKFSRRSE